jgi:hypothetical protein
MTVEPISPELVLVDPELGARARAELPDRAPLPRPALGPPAPVLAPPHRERHYPVWARVTAALWLLVLGILIGGAAIPHAQDRPRVVPKSEDATATCEAPRRPTTPPPPTLTPGVPR